MNEKNIINQLEKILLDNAQTDTPLKLSRESVRVERNGDQIILPTGMSYAEGREWLTRQERAEEKLVEILDFVDCFPLDGVVALSRTLKDMFGFTGLDDRDGFWGPEPPVMIQVPVPGGFETAPLGKLKPPKWEGGYLEVTILREPKLKIGGKIKKKFEPELQAILAALRRTLKTDSIYKGQAIMLNLEYMDPDANRPFHPVNDAPKFMDLGGAAELILNRRTEFELATSVFMLLERGLECVDNNISLKHGVLLGGGYGTGKTLTAKVVAQKATKNGWTFIYLTRAQDLANGLRIAKLYAPAVLFTEDIDLVVKEDRDEDLNDLLNTLDGVDTKNLPIITVLTTNHPEVIQPAFVRAGRIDTVILFEAPDADTAVKFVRVFARDESGNDLIKQGEDLTNVGAAMAGMVPAFICEAVGRAKRFAIYREGTPIVGKMLAEDLSMAAETIKNHMAMAARKVDKTEAEKVLEAFNVIWSARE